MCSVRTDIGSQTCRISSHELVACFLCGKMGSVYLFSITQVLHHGNLANEDTGPGPKRPLLQFPGNVNHAL
jgi:hypothetical protein